MTVPTRSRLIEEHLPLVAALARRYAYRGEQLEDLIQVGSIGLIKAVDRYCPERGVALRVFATPTIEGEIKRYLRDCTWPLHVPRSLRESRPLSEFVVDRPIAEEAGRGGHEELVDAESKREQSEDRALLSPALRGLDEHDRRLLGMRFYEDRSQVEIARTLGVSEVQISRQLRGALKKLQVAIGAQ